MKEIKSDIDNENYNELLIKEEERETNIENEI